MLWKLIRHYLRPYSGQVVAVVVLQTLTTLATLYLPSLNADIIDEGVALGDTDYIWRTGGVMLVVALVQLVTAVFAVWFGARASMSVGRDLRKAVYSKVDSFSSEEIAKFGAPTLITRGTNDVQQVQMVLLMTLNFVVMVPIMSVGGIVMAIREDPGLSWLVWTSVPVLLVILVILIDDPHAAVPEDAGRDRLNQWRDARTDYGYSRCSSFPPRALRDRPVHGRQLNTYRIHISLFASAGCLSSWDRWSRSFCTWQQQRSCGSAATVSIRTWSTSVH